MDERADLAVLAGEIAGWLRAAMDRTAAASLVVGLSGGVDSAVVCGLCALAAGPERVIAAILPVHSAARDVVDAQAAASAFGVTPRLIDLSSAYEALVAALPGVDAASPITLASDDDADRRHLALANIKPRLRMTALYYLANRYNGLVVGTGNKSELSIGYFTKHGDGGVDLLPLGELDKTAVWRLARQLGVPAEIVARAPSAGLWEDQTDEKEIGLSYADLDSALRAMATGRGDEIESSTRERIARLMASSAHKRALPPAYPIGEWRGER
jgi:NAD+ synthase